MFDLGGFFIKQINYQMKKLLLFISLFFFISSQAADITIIPQPQSLIQNKENFEINSNTSIKLINAKEADIEPLISILRSATGYKLPISNRSGKNTITFQIDRRLKLPSNEAYTLDVTNGKIIAKGKSKAGLFYASQSLRQLLPAVIEDGQKVENGNWQIPGLRIEDYPRYEWRGYMKDVSRTFYGVDVVKKYLDVMALYKLNTFHWHLTDDQGWRIEIKKYPKLTSEQATIFHHSENQPTKRSGFYTQEEIKEVVAYAKALNITIVPEIDVPGHSWPTILVYPELGVNKNSYPFHIFPFVSSWGYWGNQFTPNTLDPTKEEVYTFLKDVFTEIAELFPGEYIHFGGDEVRHILWEKEPHVLEFMKANKIDNVKKLQSYFVHRVSEIINDLGKSPIGWNDILADDENLSKNTAIMSWLGAASIKDATSNGFKAVATPSSHIYFDITQANRNDGTPSDLAYGHINSLDRIYAYDPSSGLSKDEEKLVLGVQANMWTALTQDLKDMNIHVFPRLLALAEIAWTQLDNKDFDSFMTRLEGEQKRLDALKMDYYKPGGYIAGTWSSKDIQETYSTIQFDVTSKVYTNGKAVAGFFFTKGSNYLEIDGVKLLENGKVISEDSHHALADAFRGTNKVKPFYYNLEVSSYNPNANYSIEAQVRGAGGTDSEGNFTFNLLPENDFSIVEP